VKFGESEIRLDQSPAAHAGAETPPIPGGVRIDPPIAGTWRWAGDRRLMFTPKAAWPADTKYRISLDRYEQIFSNVRAQYDAQNRVARVIAESIKTRVAAYLQTSV